MGAYPEALNSCPNCHKQALQPRIFACPKCQEFFCGSCFKIIFNGKGRRGKCPHCDSHFMLRSLKPIQQLNAGIRR